MRSPSTNLSMAVRLQRMFYIVSPNESMFETMDEVPNYVSESFIAFQLLLLLEAVVLWVKGKPMPRAADFIGSIGAGMVSRFSSLFMRGVELVAYCYVWDNHRLYSLPWDCTWTWLLTMVGVDFCYYWVHRCAHEVNFMWAAHQVHHSSEDYNLSTALRQSTLQSYSSWMFYLPLAFFVPPSVFMVHTQFNLLYQFWIHTELVEWLGPLEYIINTPSAHRVHHGRNRYCIDKNYGGTLIVFDILFGTYEAEKRDRREDKVVYGLVHPLESRNPFYMQLCHWQYMITTAIYERKGFLNRVLTFLYGPGWEPGKPRTGYLTDIPDIKYPQPKYDKECPLWYSAYAMVHFIVVSLLNTKVHEERQGFRDSTQTGSNYYIFMYQSYSEMTESSVLMSIGFILLTLTSLGAIFDHRSYGPLLELCRCAGAAVYLYVTLQSLAEPVSFGLVGFFLASSLLFAVVLMKQLIWKTGDGTGLKINAAEELLRDKTD